MNCYHITKSSNFNHPSEFAVDKRCTMQGIIDCVPLRSPTDTRCRKFRTAPVWCRLFLNVRHNMKKFAESERCIIKFTKNTIDMFFGPYVPWRGRNSRCQNSLHRTTVNDRKIITLISKTNLWMMPFNKFTIYHRMKIQTVNFRSVNSARCEKFWHRAPLRMPRDALCWKFFTVPHGAKKNSQTTRCKIKIVETQLIFSHRAV